MAHSTNNPWDRRKFVTTLATTVGGASLLTIPGISRAANNIAPHYTVKEIIDRILAHIPGAPFKQTVDTLKTGNGDQTVTGIVTTMFATDAVIKKTIAAGANFIIAHEPTFYSHTDETDWLQNDQVYQYKKELLDSNGIAVWRFHDYWHAAQPDGILMGTLIALSWQSYYKPEHPTIVTLPDTTLEQIIQHVKSALKIDMVRMIGDVKQRCSRIALLPGAWGGRVQMQIIEKQKPDVLIVGELSEWETAEYIRDARYMGLTTSLVVLGHSVSEEAGMQYLLQWLQPKVPGVKITHIPSGNPFTFI